TEIGSVERRTAWNHFQDMDLLARVDTAAHVVPTDYGQPTSERACPQLVAGGVPHEQMPAESGRDASCKGVIHRKAAGGGGRPGGRPLVDLHETLSRDPFTCPAPTI